jgi:hypothetical protein
MTSGPLYSLGQGRDPAAENIENIDGHIAVYRQIIIYSGRPVKRIWIISIKRESCRQSRSTLFCSYELIEVECTDIDDRAVGIARERRVTGVNAGGTGQQMKIAVCRIDEHRVCIDIACPFESSFDVTVIDRHCGTCPDIYLIFCIIPDYIISQYRRAITLENDTVTGPRVITYGIIGEIIFARAQVNGAAKIGYIAGYQITRKLAADVISVKYNTAAVRISLIITS